LLQRQLYITTLVLCLSLNALLLYLNKFIVINVYIQYTNKYVSLFVCLYLCVSACFWWCMLLYSCNVYVFARARVCVCVFCFWFSVLLRCECVQMRCMFWEFIFVHAWVCVRVCVHPWFHVHTWLYVLTSSAVGFNMQLHGTNFNWTVATGS